MSDPVKSVGEIKLYHHSFFFILESRVDSLLNKEDIILNLSPFNEPPLILWDDFGEKFFKPISDYFCYYLVT